MSLSDDDPVGRVGQLYVATRGNSGPGEVSVAIRGGRETFIAHSQEPIPEGATVLIVGLQPGRVVIVEPWTEFLP
jgi:hypothetical protein